MAGDRGSLRGSVFARARARSQSWAVVAAEIGVRKVKIVCHREGGERTYLQVSGE